MALDWAQVRAIFEEDDGAFCDLLVTGGQGNWQSLLDHIRSRGWPYRYSEDGTEKRLPPYAAVAEARNYRAPLLTFWPADSLPLNIHFFADDEVEATFDPRCITGQSELDALLTVVRSTARLFGSRVVVIVENSPQAELLAYEPDSDEVSHVYSGECAASRGGPPGT